VTNPVVHFEFGCRDKEAVAGFFETVFGWAHAPYGPYGRMFDIGSGLPGHVTALGHEPHSYVMVYIEVDDPAATLKAINAAGGETVIGPLPLPDGRSFAWFKDIEGHMLGLFSKAPRSAGIP
jgi:uncharacterized protein